MKNKFKLGRTLAVCDNGQLYSYHIKYLTAECSQNQYFSETGNTLYLPKLARIKEEQQAFAARKKQKRTVSAWFGSPEQGCGCCHLFVHYSLDSDRPPWVDHTGQMQEENTYI